MADRTSDPPPTASRRLSLVPSAGEDPALVREIVRLEAQRAERTVAWLRAIGGIGLAVVTTLAAQTAPSDDLGAKIRVFVPTVLGANALISCGWLWFIVRRPYREVYNYVSVLIDVAVVVVINFMEVWLGGVEGGIATALATTPATLGCVLILATASLRQNPTALLAGALVVSVAYGCIVVVGRSRAELELLPAHVAFFGSSTIWVIRAVLFGLTAVLLWLAARRAREMARKTGVATSERIRLIQVFGRYVDPHVARDALGGVTAETRVVTVLFTDLRDFTTLAEKVPPEEVLDLLNAHFAAIVPCVHEHGGTVNKFIGDAIMATFGAPIRQDDHAERAVLAARDMLLAMDDLNLELAAQSRPTLTMGIGLATGPVVVGNMGTEERVEYAVLGDTVNTAARLESMNKETKTRVLLSKATHDAIAGRVSTVFLGELPLKGKETQVAVYTLT